MNHLEQIQKQTGGQLADKNCTLYIRGVLGTYTFWYGPRLMYLLIGSGRHAFRIRKGFMKRNTDEYRAQLQYVQGIVRRKELPRGKKNQKAASAD